jgi:hypothetical protein
MKKIYTIIVASILLLGITSAAASLVPNATTTRIAPSFAQKELRPHRPTDNVTSGNLTGVYAIKNDTGYDIQGQINGTWEKTWAWAGTFEFHWNNSNNTQEGDVDAFFFGNVYIGSINITGTNDSGWLVGLFKVNETTNQFVSVALIYINDYHIRYALGTID